MFAAIRPASSRVRIPAARLIFAIDVGERSPVLVARLPPHGGRIRVLDLEPVIDATRAIGRT
jgi:hypothetical protein